MSGETTGSPGSHPYADRRNWQPAETIEDYFRDVEEGLEEYSDRRAAKLMGESRAWLWRAKLMASLPEDLFERLLNETDHVPSAKELANIARALQGKGDSADVESCPHCGGVLRVRGRWRESTAKVVNDWLKTSRPSQDGGT